MKTECNSTAVLNFTEVYKHNLFLDTKYRLEEVHQNEALEEISKALVT
jgi:hypothetical protein